MKENHNTQSCEYIIICQDEFLLYQLHLKNFCIWLKDKYKINTYIQDQYPHDPGGRDFCQCYIKQYLEKLYANVTMLFNDNLPTDLHISFQIIKLLIKKGNRNLTHNQIHINISIIHQEKGNWINYTMKYNLQSF